LNPVDSVVTASGRRLRLGSLVGKGGEADIFHVQGDNTIAVKLYTDGKPLNRLAKVRAMIADRLAERTPFVAFPVEEVRVNGSFAGFTMRKSSGSKPLFNLCISSDRKTEFPDANYRFLVRVALNYARAVASLHSLGAIIGDINESGALIDQKSGLVTMIDSDSFQYSSNGRVYRCLVGKVEYTPPELQGRPLGNVDRTAAHDAFGVAVILFEILFLGRHPFSGVPQTHDHPTIGEAIGAGRFAYSPHKAVTKMEPPKHMPVLTDIPPDVALAFQRAFGPYLGNAPRSRPMPSEWVGLLEAMEKNIVECKMNSAHYYSRSATTCPWCRFEAGYGTALFVHHFTIGRSTFDIDYLMSRIEAIASPGPAPTLVAMMLTVGNLRPSQAARELKRKSLARKAGGLATAGLSIFLMFAGLGWGFFLLIPAGMLFFGEQPGRSEIVQRKSEAERDWLAALEDWETRAGSKRFDEKLAAIRRSAALHRALPSEERDMLSALERRKQELQMQKHLEAHKIARATIDSIGDGRKLTLRSFGIETAWDVKRHSVLAVPGFGPALTRKLTDWRASVERRFRFNPNIPTDPAEIARVHAEISMRRNNTETELLKGVGELETIKAEALARRVDATPYQSRYLAFRQAEEDWKSII
jgi:DNA-binding helix-hairpin-helix protein with protein kinase domain